MDEIPGLNLLPAKWQPWAVAAAVLLPYLGRAYHALTSGGGLRGVWQGIMFGTNTPK